MSANIEQALHEKLCAYVLGELEGSERADLERELMRSPELRAEKERLEVTIGVVREALGPAEVLPPAAHAALERAVRPARIVQFPWMRMAAGIGAIGLGWWIFADGGRTVDDCLDQQVATAPMAGGELRDARLQKKLEGRVAGEKAKVELAAADAKAEGNVPRLEQGLEVVDALRSLESGSRPQGGAYTTSTEPKNSAALPSETVVGYPTVGSGMVEARLRTDLSAAVPPASAPTVGTVVLVDTTVREAPPADGSTAGAAGAVADGERALRALKGRPGGPSSPAPVNRQPGAAATGGGQAGYRGPGDSLPPARAALGDKVGASSGADSFTLYDEGESLSGETAGKDLELFARLSSLGYSGGDDRDETQRRTKAWREMSHDEQQHYLDWRCQTYVRDCQRRPSERPRDMFFRFWGDNPFEVTALDKLSTFSIDVDTASYALARRYLNEGNVPEKAQVRTEEFVNYFGSDVPAPNRGTFAVHTDLTPSRFSADSARQMLRVVVRARDVQKLERQPLRLTFVVDVSGSMREQNRLETVKHALRTLVAQLDPRDAIALVKFSTDASLVLPMTPVVDRVGIEAAIAPLMPDGSTNSNAGLQLGYAQALSGLDPASINRVVFLSDGVANVGETDAARILEGVRSIREKGIFLNTVGVGMNNHNDVLLEQLADKGDGLCNYVDSPKEIQRALVDRFTGAFQPVGRDVKIQVEFDPDQVMRYRLLGYENRAIADADFRNDAVDAGEIGAGHQVTALYEIEPTGRTGEKPLATVRVRWKPIRAAGTTPGADEATEAAFDVNAKSYQAYESSPPGHRRALIVAQFAEVLRRSIHARGDSLDDLIREADVLQKQIPEDREFAELCALLVRSKELILRRVPACDELCQTLDLLRNTCYLGATAEEAGRDARTLAEIEKTTRELEQRVRELLRRQLETR